MPDETTRRDFLKFSALSVVAGSAAAVSVSANRREEASRKINVWLTNDKVRFSPAPPLQWTSGRTAGGNTIVLDPHKTFQEILGFGAALTDASCYMLHQLSPPAREELLNELFGPSQMGFNVCRTCVGASDYSRKVYSFDEGDADPELARFSIEHDREYTLPVLRQARSVNPDLFLFSSPWSPPGWMKAGGSMLGGSMQRRYLRVYSQYLGKFLEAYGSEGVTIQALTPQNEVDTDQDGRMPACSWPQEYEIEFVRDHLGPLLEQKGIPTKIWILDHNYNLWGRAACELEDEKLRKYCNAVAWHGYVGTAEMMSRVHELQPQVEMYWTEGGPDYTSPDYQTDWTSWGVKFTDILRNWCCSITAWNLALDERGRPNIGPFSCGGLVTIDSTSNNITRSGQYWAFAHFARNIRRRARRFASEGSLSDLHHVAFSNPDSENVVVLSNSGPARSVTLQLGDSVAQIQLDQKSLATLVWR